jgi:hypothetical protein
MLLDLWSPAFIRHEINNQTLTSEFDFSGRYSISKLNEARVARCMVFNATFNISVISWRSVLLVEETGVPGENHWPGLVTEKLYHIMLVVICTDCICSCKSNYHTMDKGDLPNKTDRHDITEISLIMALYTIQHTPNPNNSNVHTYPGMSVCNL